MPELAGNCAGCSRGIPHGYLFEVSAWTVERRGSMSVQVPKTIWCRKPCRSGTGNPMLGLPRKRLRIEEEIVDEPELTAKEIAIKIWGIMSENEAYGSRKIAKLAGLDYGDYGETIVAILRDKLLPAGKVQYVDGEDGRRWRKSAV